MDRLQVLYYCLNKTEAQLDQLIDNHIWKRLGEQMSFQADLEQLE